MFEDRKVAKLVEKCYTGNAQGEEVIYLLEYFLKKSTLGKSLGNKKRPAIEVKYIKPEFEERKIEGQYVGNEKKVYLNEMLLEDIHDGVEHAFFNLLDTYGHEVRHFHQDLNGKLEGDKKSDDNIHKQSVIVKNMCEISDCKDHYDYFQYYVYYANSLECDAREGGAQYTIEVLQYLLKNKYLKQEIKDKILADLEWEKEQEKYEKKIEQKLRKRYEVLVGWFKEDAIDKFRNDEYILTKKEWDKMFDLWIDFHTPEEVAFSYVQLVGTGQKHHLLRDKLTKYINGECPKEIKDKLTERIVDSLKSKEWDERFYETELTDILDKNQILEVYESVLKNDVTKTKASLFENAMEEPEMAAKMVEILERNIGSFKANSKDELSSFWLESKAMLFFGGKKIDPQEVAITCIKMIGAGDKHASMKKRLLNYINSEDCPMKVKETVIEEIVEILSSGSVPQEYYKKEFLGVLNEDHVLEIYENLLKNDLSKIQVELFDTDHDPKMASRMADILIKNIKNVEINSPEEERLLQVTSRSLWLNGRSQISKKNTEILFEIGGIKKTEDAPKK